VFWRKPSDEPVQLPDAALDQDVYAGISTWRATAVLRAIVFDDPVGAAHQLRQQFYVLVNGCPIGHRDVVSADNSGGLDARTYSVTYGAHHPGDAYCCPGGGTQRVRFRCNGRQFEALDPMPGAIGGP